MSNDLSGQCILEIGPEIQQLGIPGLRAGFCARCFNTACSQSKASGKSWERRMDTQVDRLLRSPMFADPTSSQYAGLNTHDFPSMFHQTMNGGKPYGSTGAYEIAGDAGWDTVAQGTAKDPNPATQKQPPRKPGPKPRGQPPQDEPLEDPLVSPEMPAKGSGVPQDARLSAQPSDDRLVGEMPLMGNIPFPNEGVMVGVEPLPSPDDLPKKVVVDPWAAPIKIVPSGAKIRMGG